MVGLLTFVAGGAAQGAGAGIVAEAMQRREAALKAIEMATRGAQQSALEGTKFQHEQQLQEQKGQQDVKLENIKIAGQKEVAGIRGTSDKKAREPADVALANYMAQNIAAAEGREPTPQDRLDALDRINTAKRNPTEAARVVVDAMKLRDQLFDEGDKAKLQKVIDDLERANAKGPSKWTQLKTPQGEDAIPLAPTDPSKRDVGKRYRAPNGRTATWRGTGWEVDPQ